jgi:hypothetical protein
MHHVRLLLFILLPSIFVALSACNSGNGSAPSPPPTITGVSPLRDSDTALVTALVTAQFSIDMDPGSVTDPNNFTVVAANMSAVTASSISYDVGTRIVTFTPAADLTSGEQYIATISSAVQDTSGNNPLSRDYVWSFQIVPNLVAVSNNSTGVFGNSGSMSSAVDETGEYVVFISINDLDARYQTGGFEQVFRKNTVTGVTELVSISSNNLNVANGDCTSPRISDTGRYVVFASTAENLDPTIANPGGTSHIYRKDMRDGDISLLDVIHNNVTVASTGNSTRPDVSAQGNFVVFESTAENLVINDTNGFTDIFVVDPSGTIERVSVATSGNQSQNGSSYNPRISSDGQRIVFESEASDLVAGDSGGHTDILYRDRNATTTNFVSVDSSVVPVQADADSFNADISADGNYVVFQSVATNLVADDTNTKIDIFLRDLVANTTTRMSLKSNGDETLNGDSTLPSINTDGSYVAFTSTANDLVSIDPNVTVADIFVRNTQAADTIELLNVSPTWPNPQAGSQAAISADGHYVSFTTPNKFDDLDTNGNNDIYRAYNAALP